MPSSSESAGWVVVSVAVVAGIAQVIDRLITRWKPGVRRPKPADTADRLERERVELAQEWQEYRRAMSASLAACRRESAEQRIEIDALTVRYAALARQNTVLQIQVGVLKARMADHGIMVDDERAPRRDELEGPS